LGNTKDIEEWQVTPTVDQGRKAVNTYDQ